MKDLVLKGFVKSFAESLDMPPEVTAEIFEAFSTSVILRKYHENDLDEITDVLMGGGNDGGIDGAVILVNGRPVRSPEDLEFFGKRLRRLSFDFIFVQAKTSPEFDAGGIGTFLYGVSQFFSDDPQIRFNDEVEALRKLKSKVYDMSAAMDENPSCYAYYVTSGVWNNDPEPSARLQDGKRALNATNLFSNVDVKPVDAGLLKDVYRELKRGVTREIRFDKTAVFPSIDGVDEAYLGLLSGREYLNLISNDAGKLNRDLFYDNVRDYQGRNPVNRDIAATLGGEAVNRFPLLNNGITIVARSISRTGDNFRVSDFQIVNGCQTTHVLNDYRSAITDDTFIPVKLVVTNDSDIITEVIKATNWQTAVMPEALESLTPFHKEIEDFYNSEDATQPREARIYYERRSKQYYFDPIPALNIVTLTAQTKSFVGMFLNEPHSHPRYYGELLKAYEHRIFVADHKPAPYFASGLAFTLVQRMINNGTLPRSMRKFVYHFLMLLRIHLMGYAMPKMNSDKITAYSLGLIEKLRDKPGLKAVSANIAGEISDALSVFGGSVDGNAPDRLRSFTELLLENVQKEPESEAEPPPLVVGQEETGELRWFDDVKGYGFIDRDLGGDIFVHITSLVDVPWKKRQKGSRLIFSVSDGRKGPEASSVKLSN